jgi:hypothetical protein
VNLQPVVAHLDAHTPFRQTGGAADLAAVEDAPVLRRVRFGVLAVVANRNDPRGAAAQDALHAARTAVEAALATLTPSGAQTPPRWLRGSLVKFVQGQVWWLDEFEVSLVA